MSNLVIVNGTLIDGFGGPTVPNPGVVIAGNTIEAVGAETTPRALEGHTVIDATGQYITPGLIDGHVHLSSHQAALRGMKYTSSAEFSTLWTAHVLPQILRAGFTSISVPGGKWFVDATVRDAVNAGLLLGPRIFCAARVLTPYGGIFDTVPPWEEEAPDDSVAVLCNSVDDYVREVRRQAKRKVNFIKVADDYWGDVQGISLAELSAVADEAHRHGLKVAIHSRGSGSTRSAALADVDWIFHADLATTDDLQVVAERQVPIMPCFTQVYLLIEQGGPARLKEQLEINLEAIRTARELGIEILVGTDSGNAAAFRYGKYHGWEAGILVNEIGLTAMEALVANTRLNAKVVGLDGKVGALAEGMLADVVVWDADPLADIAVLSRPQHVKTVIKDGQVIDLSQEAFLPLDGEPERAIVNR